jgi:hypothetical protein
MKVRKKDLCNTCRKRKLQVSTRHALLCIYELILLIALQCDGKRPACTQCLFGKRECEGYPDALFVPFIATKAVVKRKTLRTPPVSRHMQSHPTHQPRVSDAAYMEFQNSYSSSRKTTGIPGSSLSSYHPFPGGPITIQEKVSLILRNFIPWHEFGCEASDLSEQSPRFCGSWVTALPQLAIDKSDSFSECLHSAVSALALSITAYRTRENLLDLVSTQYEHSLRLLGQNLAVAGNTYRSKLVAAVMCLALVEVGYLVLSCLLDMAATVHQVIRILEDTLT